jgi:hypothetical protein
MDTSISSTRPEPLKAESRSQPCAASDAAPITRTRGASLVNSLRKVLRAPPLVHTWDFYHDRENRSGTKPSRTNINATADYADRLIKIHSISDVKEFWELFNNFPIEILPVKDSVHLFKKGVKPMWEDPRNVRGGCWTFKLLKHGFKNEASIATVQEFWNRVAMLAVGEILQSAVDSDRTSECLLDVDNWTSELTGAHSVPRRYLRHLSFC